MLDGRLSTCFYANAAFNYFNNSVALLDQEVDVC